MAEETSKLTLDISDVLVKLDRYEQRLQQIEKGIVDVAKAGRDASKSFVPEGDGAVAVERHQQTEKRVSEVAHRFRYA